MSGEINLGKLLATLTCELVEDVYVFSTFADGIVPNQLRPRMSFHEAEGVTAILTKAEADTGNIPYEFPCRMITLNIHSSLQAVGFIAHIATRLAKHGMGVNPVSGFYHDHLFIPQGREQEALGILADIRSEADFEGKTE